MPTAPCPQVGAPDPSRDTSPIISDLDEDLPVEPDDAAAGVCVFNGVPYRAGHYVQSGSEVLRCEPPGVWVRSGELPPHTRVLRQ